MLSSAAWAVDVPVPSVAAVVRVVVLVLEYLPWTVREWPLPYTFLTDTFSMILLLYQTLLPSQLVDSFKLLVSISVTIKMK